MTRDYSKFSALLKGHKYAEAVAEARRMLPAALDDVGPIECLAEANLCLGDYAIALPLYERLDAHRRADPVRQCVAPGDPGWRKYVAIIHWMLGDRAKGIELFGQLVDGILDRSVNYGDIAGGVQQGLLLHYMGVTAGDEAAKTKALKYLRNRAKRMAIQAFPGPVARYYLGEIDLAAMLVAATEQLSPKRGGTADLAEAMELARGDLLTRRFMCVALFHDGVKARAEGNEAHCMKRMRECFELENPLIELEWYLARFEVEKKK